MYSRKKILNIGKADKLILAIIHFDYWVRNCVLLLFHKLLFPGKFTRNNNHKRILILRSCGLGDSVCALPIVFFIKNNFPAAQIDLLTNDKSKNKSPGIAEITAPGFFNKVFSYSRFLSWEHIKELRKEKYDLFIALPSNDASLSFELRSMLLARLAGIKTGIGWKVSTTKLFRKKQETYFIFFNETKRLFYILNQYGLKEENYYIPYKEAIYKDKKAENEINTLLSDCFLENKNKNIALIISAGRKQNKWPLYYFQEIAKFYSDKGYNIFLVGGYKEYHEAETICEKLQTKNIYNFCGQPTALHTTELLKKCLFAISNDTGAMHLAYFTGIPVIAIFSNRDYSGKWFPPESEKNVVLRAKNISCSLCFSNTCKNNICMQVISPEMVIEKAKQFF